MNDSETRGLVLRRLYEIRHQIVQAQVHDFDDLQLEPDVLVGIMDQLAQKNLIEWTPHRSGMRPGIDAFVAHIKAFGVDVVEGTERPPIAITIDSSVNVHGSQNVQIGGEGNVQTVTMDIDKMVTAVGSSNASLAEREEAKSILKRMANSKLVQTVIVEFFKKHFGGGQGRR
jgi:hypothetical protein